MVPGDLSNDSSVGNKSTYLQILARMSPLPVANKLFVGLGATEITITKLDEGITRRSFDTNQNFCGPVASSAHFP